MDQSAMIAHDGKTLLVIPTYNERGNIEQLVEEIHRQQLGLDFLIIDDHSPDGTGALADELSRRLPITVIHREKKFGIGSAHKAGFRYAMAHQYEYVMTMDADFSHSPEYLRPMLDRAASADVVLGSRYVQGGGFAKFGLHRLLLTKTVHWLTSSLLGLSYDCTGGLRVYRVAALARLDEMEEIPSNSHAFLIEILFHIKRHGGVIHEYPITIQPRREGKSKVSLHELLRSAASLVRLSTQGGTSQFKRGALR